MSENSIQVQSVLYNNEKTSLMKALESLNRAIEINSSTTKEVGDVTVYYGDASKDPIFTDNEIEEINKRFGKSFILKYTYFNENTGTAKGHNKLGKECESDYMLIMNPDVLVCPRFFAPMFEPFLDPANKAGLTEGRQTPVEHPKEYDKVTFETGWASTACTLFPTEIFNKVNGFDEQSFFMYCDDLDFSWRIRLLGKKIYYRPDAVIYHAKTLTTDGAWNPSNTEIYYSTEAALMMAYKWSNNKRFKKLYNTFSNSDNSIQKRAAAHFDELRKSGKLPTQLDSDHKVAQFIGENYTKHRFAL